MIQKIDPKMIPYDGMIRALCCLPFHGHNKGCPNYGKKQGCPPQKVITKIFDFEKELYIIFSEFDIGKFAERMRLAHPEWREVTYSYNKSPEVMDFFSRLSERNPEWISNYFAVKNQKTWKSSRQWYNPRLWQPKARKEHKKELEKFMSEHPLCVVDRCPEAHGVNITGLMHNLGIKLNWQWPPEHNLENKSYVISLAGYPKN